MRLATALVATTVAGVLHALAFPMTGLASLPWVALRSGGPRRAVGLACLWTVVTTGVLNLWFPRAVSVYYLQAVWVGVGLFLAVTLLTAAPAFVLFAFVWRRAGRQPAWTAPLVA